MDCLHEDFANLRQEEDVTSLYSIYWTEYALVFVHVISLFCYLWAFKESVMFLYFCKSLLTEEDLASLSFQLQTKICFLVCLEPGLSCFLVWSEKGWCWQQNLIFAIWGSIEAQIWSCLPNLVGAGYPSYMWSLQK